MNTWGKKINSPQSLLYTSDGSLYVNPESTSQGHPTKHFTEGKHVEKADNKPLLVLLCIGEPPAYWFSHLATVSVMGIVRSWQRRWGAVWRHDWWRRWADVWQLQELPWAASRQKCQVLRHQRCNWPLCSPLTMTAMRYSNCLPCAGSSGHAATALSVVISTAHDWLILLHNLLWARIVFLEWRVGER